MVFGDHCLDWRHIDAFHITRVITLEEFPMSWIINNQNQNYCIWSTSYPGATAHILLSSEAQRQMPSTYKDDEYKYIVQIFKCITCITHKQISFSYLQRKLRERKNWSQICRLNLSPSSLFMKVSCEPSRSQISLFPLSHTSFPPITSLAVVFWESGDLIWNGATFTEIPLFWNDTICCSPSALFLAK